MKRTIWLVPLIMALVIIGCGPETIFLRPGLDTPSQHVSNGNHLLERGKLDDACREFYRAKELDPNYVQAYIGLGVALGRKGEMEAGMKALATADELAATPQEDQLVQNGYEQLNRMEGTETGGQKPN